MTLSSTTAYGRYRRLRDVATQAVDARRLRHFQSIPVGFAVDWANHHYMKLVWATVDSLPVARAAPGTEYHQGLCLDKGYDLVEVRRTLDEFVFTDRSRGEGVQAIRKETVLKARR